MRNTQLAHAGLVSNVSAANPTLSNSALAAAFHLPQPTGFIALNDEVTRQAAMIAYVDDFLFMFVLTLIVIPLLVLVRPPPRRSGPAEPVALE